MPAESPVLYTLGYEQRSLEEFLLMLRSNGMKLVIDVRDVAWSHKPGFAKKPLMAALASAGIHYHHAQFAGNPKRLRLASSSLEEMLERYEEHLDANPRITESFAGLVAEARRQKLKTCIICFERDPAQCHRSILAQRWSELAGGEVVALQ